MVGLRFLSGAGGLRVTSARTARHRGRRGRHRDICARVSQLDGELHGSLAQSEVNRRHVARRQWAASRRTQNFRIFLPLNDRDYLAVGAGRTRAEVPNSHNADAARFDEFSARLAVLPKTVRETLLMTPPNVTETGWTDALPELIKAGGLGRSFATARTRGAARFARACSANRRRSCSTAVRKRSDQRQPSASMPLSETMPAPNGPAPAMCCSITHRRGELARRASGVTPSAAWVRSPKRWCRVPRRRRPNSYATEVLRGHRRKGPRGWRRHHGRRCAYLSFLLLRSLSQLSKLSASLSHW